MTKIYAMTGGATGIGASVKEKLRERGDTVIVVDLHDAEIVADLSTVEGRNKAIDGIKSLSPDGLDGFVACAGLPPVAKPLSLISRVNYFGSVDVIEGLVDWVAKKSGSIVAVSSNSASMAGLNEEYIQALLAGDEDKACSLIDNLDGHNAYAGSKNALARWLRRRAPEYIREKRVRLNAVAPGITATPLTDKVFNDEHLGAAMVEFEKSVPFGEMASPAMIADTMLFLLDSASRFVCGSILFVDGGHDALLRPDQF
jgi:NAD(P)-dependent dehydrogenase (short-subunit alcohol dehydrogenase family)